MSDWNRECIYTKQRQGYQKKDWKDRKMLELEKGRPDDPTGRLDKEIRTYDLLDKLGIEYKRIDHDHTVVSLPRYLKGVS